MPGNPPKRTCHDASLTRNDIFETMAKLIESYGNNLNAEYIAEITRIIIAADAALMEGTSRADGFFSFADIEELFMEQTRSIVDAHRDSFLNRIKNAFGEDSVVLKEIENFKKME
jgi:hypothetical protein